MEQARGAIACSPASNYNIIHKICNNMAAILSVFPLDILTIIRNKFLSPPPRKQKQIFLPFPRNFLLGGSVDLFWNDPITTTND